MLDVNFIVTCHDHEDFWEYNKRIIGAYKKINPHVAFCYNGNRTDYPCDYRCNNRGKQLGEIDLMQGGFRKLQTNGVNHWVKICADCWLVDEDKILEIFGRMEEHKAAYAGCRWEGENNRYSTDVFFSIGDFVLRAFFSGAEAYIRKTGHTVENYMAIAARQYPFYLIPERDKKFSRDSVTSLSWALSDSLEKNMNLAREYSQKLQKETL